MTSSGGPGTDKRVKNWNALTGSENEFQVSSVEIIESDILAPQLIEFGRAIAFVGLHGAGKSLILRTIRVALGYVNQYGTPPFLNFKEITGIVRLTLKTPAGLISHTVDLSQPSNERAKIWKNDLATFSASYIDSHEAFAWLTYMFENFTDFYPSRSKDISKEGLDSFRNIIGRAYDRVSIQSAMMDDGVGDNLQLPFITAESGAKVLDNTTMSQGELWVYYMHWFLRNEVDTGGLALIDEPEAFIAARGRRPFIDHIARQALSRRLQLVVGTHSPEILSRFPLANIRMCIPGDNGIRVISPTSLFQIHEHIGIETPVRGLVVVEDEMARQLLNFIFARYDTALTREIDIFVAGNGGGEANVMTALKLLSSPSRLTCLAVLDADQRHKEFRTTDKSRSSIHFLPGDKAPERELLANAQAEPQWIADAIGATPGDIIIAINSHKDVDHQYQIKHIARHLGYKEENMISELTNAWLRQPRIARQAEELVKAIRNSLPGSK